MSELKFIVGTVCEPGICNYNEDVVIYNPEKKIVVVADGAGGHVGGAIASKTASEIIINNFDQGIVEGPGESLFRAFFLAHNKIVDKNTGAQEQLSRLTKYISSQRDITIPDGQIRSALIEKSWDGKTIDTLMKDPDGIRVEMATTATVAALGETTYIKHTGDSVAYLIRDGQIRQLTDDHSYMALEMKKGRSYRELIDEVRGDTLPGYLESALGWDDLVIQDVDPLTPQPGDYIVIASDGLKDMLWDDQPFVLHGKNREDVEYKRESKFLRILTDFYLTKQGYELMGTYHRSWEDLDKGKNRLLLDSTNPRDFVNEQIIVQTVLNSPTPQDACNALYAIAMLRGGEDNIGIAVVQVGEK